jgi:hypothetical protein
MTRIAASRRLAASTKCGIASILAADAAGKAGDGSGWSGKSRLRAEPRSYGALAALARGTFSPGLLTQARAEVHGLRASAPAADQLVFGDAVLGEKAFRVVVLDRVR